MPELPDREKRRSVFCRTEQALNTWQIARQRNINCDVPKTIDQVFYIPEDGPAGVVEFDLPFAILLSNQELIVVCDFDTSGGASPPGPIINPGSGSTGAYLINAGEFNIEINYSDIPNITDIQLDHIATLDQDLINVQFSNYDLSAINLMRLKSEQREYLTNIIQESLATLYSNTYGIATAMLVCNFSSDEFTVCCPQGLTVTFEGETSACVKIAQGAERSTKSKSDANTKAIIRANDIIEQCVVGNDYVKLNCGAGDKSKDSINAVGFIEILKDSVFAENKELANSRALAQAKDQLFCSYCNKQINKNCKSGEIFFGPIEDKYSELDEKDRPKPDPTKGDDPESIVLLADSSICASTSEELANIIEAFIEDAKTITCLFGNDDKQCDCADVTDPLSPSSEKFDYTSANGNPLGESFIPANTFFSSVSKDDANEIAKEECFAELLCGYCSDPVPDCPTPFNVNEERPPAVNFCEYQSFISKADANLQAWLSVDIERCKEECPEKTICLPDDGTITGNTVKGKVCNITTDAEGNSILSYCVPEDGGGGGGGDGECPKGSSCMTLNDAIIIFGKDGFEQKGKKSCGKTEGDKEKGIKPEKKYCIAPKPVNPPKPDPDPNNVSCPGDCECIDNPTVWKAENPDSTLEDCTSSGLRECTSKETSEGGNTNTKGTCFKVKKKDTETCAEPCTCIHDANYYEYAAKYKISACDSAEVTFHCAGEDTRSACYILEEKEDTTECPVQCTCGIYEDLKSSNPYADIIPCGGQYCGESGGSESADAPYCYFIQEKEVEGGSGSLVWEDCYGFQTPLITWEKGVVVTDSVTPIKIVAGCSESGTPETP